MSEQPTEDLGFPLAEIALDMVRRAPGADEAYTVHPTGPEVIKAAVKALMLSDEPPLEKAKVVRRALALCYVLEERENCPKAAALIGGALLADPETVRLLGGAKDQQTAQAKQYRQFLDDRDVERAPRVDAKAPDGSLKLHAFLNPGQQRAKPGPARRPPASGSAPSARPGPAARTNRPSGAPDSDPSSAKGPRRRTFKT